MIENVYHILSTVGYVGAVIVAALLVANSLQRKKRYWLKTLLLSAGIAGASFFFEELVRHLSLNRYILLTIRTSNCAMVFSLTMGMLKLCYDCAWQKALFCVTAGYCMEHFSQRLTVLILLLIPVQFDRWLILLMTLLMRFFSYLGLYLGLLRKVNLTELKGTNKTQIIIAAIIILFTIYASGFSEMSMAGIQSILPRVLFYLFSLALCVIGLFVEFYQVLYDRVRMERDVLQQIIRIEAEKYEREKATIDVINVKYHDLKHELHRLEAEYGKEKLRDMRQAINGYDSFFRTGNVALDTVLTLKSYSCIQKKIQLTCMANGEKLQRLSEADVYSLFGNMLDNAIEAVEKLPEAERIISLNVVAQSSFLFIHCENYCLEAPMFVDGMPQTTKRDKNYHGIGTHSLQLLAERYDGVCNFGTTGRIFYTDIVLPI